MNFDLKMELMRRFGSQVLAARIMGIRENRLSYIVRGHGAPSERELEALERGLGRACARKLFKKAEAKKEETTHN